MTAVHWLKLARRCGYEKGFTTRPNVPLLDLEALGLIERNPTTRGRSTHWRITQKGIDFKP